MRASPTWASPLIRKNDVTVSKNYFGDSEVRELNRLTTILLDIFEDQADLGRLVLMDDARRILDQQLQSLGRVLLTHGGSVSANDAKRRAERQYAIYSAGRKAERQLEADKAIAALKEQNRALPKPTRTKK